MRNFPICDFPTNIYNINGLIFKESFFFNKNDKSVLTFLSAIILSDCLQELEKT